jgi:curved DNA-binding protein CbpA
MSKKTLQDLIQEQIDKDFRSLVESMSHDEARSVLGLEPDHSEDELKTAFRAASKRHHPDLGGSPEAMKHVNAAYEKLKGAGGHFHADQGGDPIFNKLRHPDSDVRANAIQHPNVQHHHIDHALNDNDYWVRLKAVSHPNAQPHHIDKALDDKDSMVANAAMEHPNATHDNISKGLRHEDESVREDAIRHPNSHEGHIDQALNDDSSFVRFAAMEHPKVHIGHIEKGLHDEDEDVRKLAIDHLRRRGAFKA